eukprot:TRINITY_DN5409_c0_g2_i4.p1 TRINITY_DN5409_c0_g2~~TRINITY_DN5409_c0_g2_i4.p1  ORF type:complete len:194 (-),score=13.09 TRINITY_DN5409_c0_g2_i4:217-798(-)
MIVMLISLTMIGIQLRFGTHKLVNQFGNKQTQNQQRYKCIIGDDWRQLNSKIRFQVKKIEGDGACMFRALVQSNHYIQYGQFLNLDEESQQARDLRIKIVEELKKNREFIEPFLIEQPFDQYIQVMRMDHTWGGEPELAMAPACIERPVVVYQKTGRNQIKLFMTYGEKEYGQSEPVLVLFQGLHYDALIISQ